jgi:ABC-type dipeptide/oligopeptide/nickel transport system permease subunit
MTAQQMADVRPLAAQGRRRGSRLLRAIRKRPLAALGAGVIIAWLVAALLAPWISPANPQNQTFAHYSHPSSAHLFGTDELGRDVLSRVIWGARISLPLATLLIGLSVTIGVSLGVIAGYFRGWADGVIMRLTDLVFAFPAIILALVITAVLGPSLQNAVLALVVVSWPTYARVVRGLVLSVGNADFVQASRLLGASAPRALARDVLPNVVGPVVVLVTLDFGNAILLLSALSFLGLGAQAPTPEWGAMVSEGTQYFQQWWIGTFPGLAIFTAVLSLNFLGDSLRDALDPHSSWTTRGRDRDGAA